MCLCYRLCVAVELVLSVVFQDDMAFGLLFYEICQIFAGFVVPLCRLEYVGKFDRDLCSRSKFLTKLLKTFDKTFREIFPVFISTKRREKPSAFLTIIL